MAEGIEEGRSTGAAGVAEAESVRAQLRRRWELASVLNFLRVFRPVIGGKLEVTGEEVEEALIYPDDVLARIHVALLKGIPPVSKNVDAPDAWVTLACKQMDMWWSWVADGDAPIRTNRGAEVSMYKSLDPLLRLRMLKALCEIRAVQDDIIAYIGEALKNGSPLSTFRKDKIGTDSNGNDYWWDGDGIMGYRLYRESMVVDDKQRLKGKKLIELTTNYHWETLACDLEQFQDISVKLSENKAFGDVQVAEMLKTEVIPLVEKLWKKREKALKRQQREALNLTAYLGVTAGTRRSCRDRKPARYTFDDYDQSIDEALQIERKRKAPDMHTGAQFNTQAMLQVDGDEKPMTSGSEDEDYDDKNDLVNDSHEEDSEVEPDKPDSPGTKEKKPAKMIDATGLRRSMRNMPFPSQPSRAASNGHAEMKKRLRQRPIHNTDYTVHAIPDSEDESEDDIAVRGKSVDVLLHTVSGVSTPATAVR